MGDNVCSVNIIPADAPAANADRAFAFVPLLTL